LDEILMVPEAAKKYRIGRSTLYLWCEQDACPHLRIGKSVRIPVAAFEAWLARHTRGGDKTLAPAN
jgi:excisionase family DNA binding protein